MQISLKFADKISEAYREKLQTFVNDVVAQGIIENRPPSIQFPGMNDTTYYEIFKLQCAYDRSLRSLIDIKLNP